MKKELIICAVVIIGIVILNTITSRNTNRVMDEITTYLGVVREGIALEEENQMQENIKRQKKLGIKKKIN